VGRADGVAPLVLLDVWRKLQWFGVSNAWVINLSFQLAATNVISTALTALWILLLARADPQNLLHTMAKALMLLVMPQSILLQGFPYSNH